MNYVVGIPLYRKINAWYTNPAFKLLYVTPVGLVYVNAKLNVLLNVPTKAEA
jgi:hypothetical protein